MAPRRDEAIEYHDLIVRIRFFGSAVVVKVDSRGKIIGSKSSYAGFWSVIQKRNILLIVQGIS